MPPQIALLLCAGFIIFLLRIERRCTPEVSPTLWIPTVWMLSIACKPLAQWLNAERDEGGSPLDRIFQSALLCLGVIVVVKRGLDWAEVKKRIGWLLFLASFMLVSVIWADLPWMCFKRWVREMPAVAMALIILTEASPRQAAESIIRKQVYILIPLSLLLIKYFPDYGVHYGRWSGEYMWVGVTMQKNGLGRLCLIAGFYLVWTLLRRIDGRDLVVSKYQTPAELLLLFLTLWLLKGPAMKAASATGIISLSLGLGFLFVLRWMKRHQLYIPYFQVAAVIVSLISLGVVTPILGGASVSAFTGAVGRDATLTGRTEVWAAVLPVIAQSPILGCGTGGFWTPATRAVYEISEAHNGYLEVLLELGTLGLAIVAAFFLSTCRKAQLELQHDFDWACLCLCFLFMSLMHNVSESSLSAFSNQLTATIIILSVTVPSSAAST